MTDFDNQPAVREKEHDDSPKFGRLLIVLALAVLLMVLITFLSEAYYS